jgi:hypothetical protein
MFVPVWLPEPEKSVLKLVMFSRLVLGARDLRRLLEVALQRRIVGRRGRRRRLRGDLDDDVDFLLLRLPLFVDDVHEDEDENQVEDGRDGPAGHVAEPLPALLLLRSGGLFLVKQIVELFWCQGQLLATWSLEFVSRIRLFRL